MRENEANIDWIKELNYKENQVHDISFGFFNPCPTVPVKINGKEINLLFDTGNASGIFLTTAIEGKVNYEITGKAMEYNADGTYRGEGKAILLNSINVFDEKYSNINSVVNDWRMYGFFKINGAIGLEYFKNKVVTLDYKSKKIAVSGEALDYSKLNKDKCTVLPLITSSISNEKDLLFFQGEVNGKKSTIYLDTGSTRSFLYSEKSKDTRAEVKLGNKKFKFDRLKYYDDRFKDNFEYPLRLAINSDLLKANDITITIDKIQNKLIICQN